MKHVNNTYNAYVKTSNELQVVLDYDFSSFQVRDLAAAGGQPNRAQHQRSPARCRPSCRGSSGSRRSKGARLRSCKCRPYEQPALQQKGQFPTPQAPAHSARAFLPALQMREHAALEKMEENQEQMEALEEARNQGLQPHQDKVSIVLSEVEGTANALQRFLNDHAFAKAQYVKDASLITVVKIQEHRERKSSANGNGVGSAGGGASNSGGGGGTTGSDAAFSDRRRRKEQEMTWLVDADNNQASRPASRAWPTWRPRAPS
jgi:hypothetical protein